MCKFKFGNLLPPTVLLARWSTMDQIRRRISCRVGPKINGCEYPSRARQMCPWKRKDSECSIFTLLYEYMNSIFLFIMNFF